MENKEHKCDCGCEHDHECDCGCGCEDEVLTLTDEDGVDTNFVIIDGVEYNDKMYLALVEEEHINDESCEFVILRADTDDDGNDYFNTIEDEEEFKKVVALLQDKMDENEDGFDLEIEN